MPYTLLLRIRVWTLANSFVFACSVFTRRFRTAYGCFYAHYYRLVGRGIELDERKNEPYRARCVETSEKRKYKKLKIKKKIVG